MKKIYLLIITASLILSPFVAAVASMPTRTTNQTEPSPLSANFTHTVFVEEATTTWCPNCPTAAEALYNLYTNNSEFPFYFVALVSDQSSVAKQRFVYHYRGRAIPTVFFDGGFIQQVGAETTVPATEELYRGIIDECGAREIHPLEVTTTVTGHDDAKLDITVTVTNTGDARYIGIVKSYVTEIVSRWINEAGDNYHFGFLDYAVNKLLILKPDASKTYTVTWDGAAKHGNLTFSDITDDNIMVITTVAHIKPYVVEAEQYVQKHLAFYVDQTVGATVE